MGQKRKKTNIIDSTEIKKVSKKFVRGDGPDLKSIQDKKLKRELIVREKHNAQAIRSAAFNQLLLPEVCLFTEFQLRLSSKNPTPFMIMHPIWLYEVDL